MLTPKVNPLIDRQRPPQIGETMTTPIATPLYVDSPPVTEEAHYHKLAAMAFQEAERVIKKGEATSQMLVHFSSLSPEMTQLKAEELRLRNELLRVRVENESRAGAEEVSIAEVLEAFRSYTLSPRD